MNKTNYIEVASPILVRTERLASELETGKATAKEIGMAAGARVQIGRCVYWNREKVKEYINSISG